jgi:Domain of unknown function (DUF4386)
MTTTTAPAVPTGDAERPALVRTARATGLLYLGVALTGGIAFLGIRTQLYVEGDPGATLANLVENEGLARLGVVLEIGLVLTQVLCALWFFRLFRTVDAFAAGCIAVFGAINAVAIMVSAALLGTALDVAGGALDDPESAAETVQLLYLMSGNVWGVAGIFFGLWLIPMGWLARRSGWMPATLGWILIIGGVGYILGAFVAYGLPSARAAADALAFPAAIGELWMVGYLLIIGVRRTAASA